jgi:outer membrane receptor protein involved in Fe transport
MRPPRIREFLRGCARPALYRVSDRTLVHPARPCSLPANLALDRTFPARWLTDLSATYQVLANLSLAAGADNLFDVYPGENVEADSNGRNFPYSGFSPLGFNGRFLFVRAAYRR